MLVPESGSRGVRVRPIDGSANTRSLGATWRAIEGGYRVVVDLDIVPVALDVIVNVMPRGRVRRRGQLVLSGAQGEFVYLRGDRHPAERLIAIRRISDD